MKIALTGATGFLGRYILDQLLSEDHTIRAWTRREVPERSGLEWIQGELNDEKATKNLVEGCDAVVHAALYRPAKKFQQLEGSLTHFATLNVLGSLRLIETAHAVGVPRFVFISTCAVHDKILPDRPLDESHPLWALSHYGAHKGAIEKFVHSYGFGEGYDICALRPTGIYGIEETLSESKWYGIVSDIVNGREVTCDRGGKEVHAADVATAASLLLSAKGIAGECYNCYDRYVSEYEVAVMAKKLSGSSSVINGCETKPKHEIETGKIRALGMNFGGKDNLERHVAYLVEHAVKARSGK